MTLDKLAKGVTTQILAFSNNDPLSTKLREIGFAEGDEVELLARGPLGGWPISVRLNRTVIALRKEEAALIEIDPRP